MLQEYGFKNSRKLQFHKIKMLNLIDQISEPVSSGRIQYKILSVFELYTSRASCMKKFVFATLKSSWTMPGIDFSVDVGHLPPWSMSLELKSTLYENFVFVTLKSLWTMPGIDFSVDVGHLTPWTMTLELNFFKETRGGMRSCWGQEFDAELNSVCTIAMSMQSLDFTNNTTTAPTISY